MCLKSFIEKERTHPQVSPRLQSFWYQDCHARKFLSQDHHIIRRSTHAISWHLSVLLWWLFAKLHFLAYQLLWARLQQWCWGRHWLAERITKLISYHPFGSMISLAGYSSQSWTKEKSGVDKTVVGFRSIGSWRREKVSELMILWLRGPKAGEGLSASF